MEKIDVFLPKIKKFNDFHMPRYIELPEIELYMDQVITVIEKFLGVFETENMPILTPSMINNYVKNGIIPPPVKKKYNRGHLVRLLIICIMKPVMELPAIADVITRNEKLFGVEGVLDEFAPLLEENLVSRTAYAVSEFEKADDKEKALCTVATVASVRAATQKMIADQAYSAIRPEEKKNPKEHSDKDKTKIKTKEKPAEAEAGEKDTE